MREIGRVVTANEAYCEVEFVRSQACAGCQACSRFSDTAMRIRLPNTVGAREGDCVLVEMGAVNVVGASLWAYIFPLIMLLIGGWVGSMVAAAFSIQTDWLAAICALIFAGLGFLVLKILNPYFARKRSFQPVLVRIEENGEQQEG